MAEGDTQNREVRMADGRYVSMKYVEQSDGSYAPLMEIGAGESYLGSVGTPGDVVNVTLTLDTAPYADGDVLADFQEVTNFFRVAGGRALIQSITVLDKDDQGVAFDILSGPNAVSLGTENTAPNISDANAESVQRLCRIEVSDYIDLGGSRIATKAGIGVLVEGAPASRSFYIGAITRGGTPTYTASGVILRIGALWL